MRSKIKNLQIIYYLLDIIDFNLYQFYLNEDNVYKFYKN